MGHSRVSARPFLPAIAGGRITLGLYLQVGAVLIPGDVVLARLHHGSPGCVPALLGLVLVTFVAATLLLGGGLADRAGARGQDRRWGWMAVLGVAGYVVVLFLPRRAGPGLPRGFPLQVTATASSGIEPGLGPARGSPLDAVELPADTPERTGPTRVGR